MELLLFVLEAIENGVDMMFMLLQDFDLSIDCFYLLVLILVHVILQEKAENS